MLARLTLRLVVHTMRLVGVVQATGIHVPNRFLHRAAAVYKRVRKLLWPVLIRKTPFKRVVEISQDTGSIASLTRLVVLIAPWTVHIDAGPYRTFADHTYDFDRGRLNLKGAFVASFRRAFLNTATGLVCTADGELIADSAKKIERHIDAATGLDLSSARFLQGNCTTVMSKPGGNYYHWFNDSLLRLYLLHCLDDRAPVKILVPPNLRPYQMQSLAFCLPEKARIETVHDEWVQVEQLILPSFITEPLVGMVPPVALAYVRGRIIGRICGADRSSERRRIYVSRGGTNRRQILNEDDLVACLTARRFEIIRPENLSFDDQVRLFHAAEVIVGPRGAGLTNILFAERAKVLEITGSSPFAGTVYFSLAYSLGLEYHHLFCDQRGKAYVVDLEAFEHAVDSLLAA